jgi:hypothetical protein
MSDTFGHDGPCPPATQNQVADLLDRAVADINDE